MSYYRDGRKYVWTDEDYDFGFLYDILERKDDGLFHISPIDGKKPVATSYCKECGGREFNVGTGSLWTGIRCVNCGWEICIHEG